MVKSIKQYVYNTTEEKDINKGIADTLFTEGRGLHFLEVGIQTLPGTKISIGGNTIIIGRTGIFNLNTEGFGEIQEITIDKNTDIENPLFYFILDAIILTESEGQGGK